MGVRHQPSKSTRPPGDGSILARAGYSEDRGPPAEGAERLPSFHASVLCRLVRRGTCLSTLARRASPSILARSAGMTRRATTACSMRVSWSLPAAGLQDREDDGNVVTIPAEPGEAVGKTIDLAVGVRSVGIAPLRHGSSPGIKALDASSLAPKAACDRRHQRTRLRSIRAPEEPGRRSTGERPPVAQKKTPHPGVMPGAASKNAGQIRYASRTDEGKANMVSIGLTVPPNCVLIGDRLGATVDAHRTGPLAKCGPMIL